MSFKNAEIKRKANIYHDGRVTSRTVITPEGEHKTLGIMLPGTYTFNTDAPEVMELIQGRCRMRVGAGEWREYEAGQSFSVPAKARFDIEVRDLLDYICHFG